MTSRLKKNHPELFEQETKQFDDTLIVPSQQVDDSSDTPTNLKEPRKSNINRFLTIGIVIEVILLAIILFIAFKK